MADAMEQQLRDDQTKIIFGNNPHREGTKIFKTFETAKVSTTIGQARQYASLWELRSWVKNENIHIKVEEDDHHDAIRGGKDDMPNPFLKMAADSSSTEDGYDRPRVKDR